MYPYHRQVYLTESQRAERSRNVIAQRLRDGHERRVHNAEQTRQDDEETRLHRLVTEEQPDEVCCKYYTDRLTTELRNWVGEFNDVNLEGKVDYFLRETQRDIADHRLRGDDGKEWWLWAPSCKRVNSGRSTELKIYLKDKLIASLTS